MTKIPVPVCETCGAVAVWQVVGGAAWCGDHLPGGWIGSYRVGHWVDGTPVPSPGAVYG